MTLVVIGADALARLSTFVSGPALAVMDTNTREAVGERVVSALRAEAFVFERRSGLRAGLSEADAVRGALLGGRVPVAVGSGVITDIVRFAAHAAGTDFISVPTAASMDGYASSGAAMEVNGVKVTYDARPPVAIFADPLVVAAAPDELTRAGIGDLLGKVTARVDWLAAHLLYGEAYAEEIADRMLVPLAQATSSVRSILAGSPDGARVLLKGLIESGLAMAAAGSSRPASGSEHHASHFWDLLAARGARAHAAHGLQVGYATRFAMRLQRFAFDGGVPRLTEPRAIADAPPWMSSPVVVDAVAAKRRFVSGGFVSGWDAVCRALAPELGRFEEVERALDEARFPSSPGYLGIEQDMVRDAFRYGSRLRARYTVVDFLEGQGMLEQALSRLWPPAATHR